LPGPDNFTAGVVTANLYGCFLESLAPLRYYGRDRSPDAVVIDQDGYRIAEDSETARAEPSSTKPAGFYPPIHGPPTDVQNSGRFVDTEKPLLLQGENRVHDTSPRTHAECLLKNFERLPTPSTLTHHQTRMSWSNEASTSLANTLAVTASEDFEAFPIKRLRSAATGWVTYSIIRVKMRVDRERGRR
jgi:hypothetical protein